MTYETVRDAAKELALNAIAIEKRDENPVAAKVAVESIRIHEQSALAVRAHEVQHSSVAAVWCNQLQGLDLILM